MNYLTSLRGLAALVVMMYHIKDHLKSLPGFSSVSEIYVNGYLGVDFFFVLSGFIIAFKYSEVFKSKITAKEFINFVIKRIARIYPLHFFIMLLFLSIPLALWFTGREVPSGDYSALGFLFKMLLVDSWLLGYPYWEYWNTPSWTISTEFFVYLAFPILTFLAWNRSFVTSSIVYLLIYSCFVLAFHLSGANTIGENITTNGLIRCIVEFSLGMLCCKAYMNVEKRGLFAIAVTFLFLTITLSVFSTLPNYLYIPFMYAAVLTLFLITKSWFHLVLNHKYLVYLGEISYSIYLSHVYFRNALGMLMLENNEVGNAAFVVSYFIITLVFSIFAYEFIEIRARKFLVKKYCNK